MASPFVAEIYLMANSFPPTGFAFCRGQLMPISQNTALFALLGTMYGGDGKSTFALPDLQATAPMHWGQGQGLTEYPLPGITGGAPFVTLLQSEMPAHAHSPVAARAAAGLPPLSDPTNAVWAGSPERPYAPPNNLQPMAPTALSIAGGSQPHNNLMPYLALNFVIALQGVFPPRS